MSNSECNNSEEISTLHTSEHETRFIRKEGCVLLFNTLSGRTKGFLLETLHLNTGNNNYDKKAEGGLTAEYERERSKSSALFLKRNTTSRRMAAARFIKMSCDKSYRGSRTRSRGL